MCCASGTWYLSLGYLNSLWNNSINIKRKLYHSPKTRKVPSSCLKFKEYFQKKRWRVNWEKWSANQIYFIGYQREFHWDSKWRCPIFFALSPTTCLHSIRTGTRDEDRLQCAQWGEMDLNHCQDLLPLHWLWQVSTAEICSQLVISPPYMTCVLSLSYSTSPLSWKQGFFLLPQSLTVNQIQLFCVVRVCCISSLQQCWELFCLLAW